MPRWNKQQLDEMLAMARQHTVGVVHPAAEALRQALYRRLKSKDYTGPKTFMIRVVKGQLLRIIFTDPSMHIEME